MKAYLREKFYRFLCWAFSMHRRPTKLEARGRVTWLCPSCGTHRPALLRVLR